MVVALTAIATLLGSLILTKAVKNFEKNLRESKIHATTTATVKKKDYVRFSQTHNSYVNDLGQRIEMQPGQEQWRVYYEFDNFDQIDQPRRSSLLQAEQQRLGTKGLRFTAKSKQWYEKIEAGDKLEVLYHPIGNNKIEVANVKNPKYPYLQ